MPWLQVKISAPREEAELLEDALLASGALSVTLEDDGGQAILEPSPGETPLWEQTRLTALFSADMDTAAVSDKLRSRFPKMNLALHWEPVADRHWEREWMKDYQPIRCGERLLICPSWATPDYPSSANTVKLILDPGLAFGTGSHPTTFLCLQWLEQQDLTGQTVIDYGCGSGILGIAALLLGARSAVCVDIDPQALLATRENTRRNCVDPHRIATCLPDALPIVQAEVVVANILAGPLIELAPKLADLTLPGGKLCLSGILADQSAALIDRYRSWFDMSTPSLFEEWVRLSAIKR